MHVCESVYAYVCVCVCAYVCVWVGERLGKQDLEGKGSGGATVANTALTTGMACVCVCVCMCVGVCARARVCE